MGKNKAKTRSKEATGEEQRQSQQESTDPAEEGFEKLAEGVWIRKLKVWMLK